MPSRGVPSCRNPTHERACQRCPEQRAIRRSISEGRTTALNVLNYRKDGSVFNNMLSLRPLFDREGHLVFMVSISIEVKDQFAGVKPLLAQLHRTDGAVQTGAGGCTSYSKHQSSTDSRSTRLLSAASL